MVHTKGRFFSLYGDKAAGRATRMDCRDVFDSLVFFSKACWVGQKEDNPSEEPLPLPESLQVSHLMCGVGTVDSRHLTKKYAARRKGTCRTTFSQTCLSIRSKCVD